MATCLLKKDIPNKMAKYVSVSVFKKNKAIKLPWRHISKEHRAVFFLTPLFIKLEGWKMRLASFHPFFTPLYHMTHRWVVKRISKPMSFYLMSSIICAWSEASQNHQIYREGKILHTMLASSVVCSMSSHPSQLQSFLSYANNNLQSMHDFVLSAPPSKWWLHY